MRTRVRPARRAAWAVALAIGLTMALNAGCAVAPADAGDGGSPGASADATASASVTTSALATGSMIIDRRHTKLADVPLEWIEAAKSDLHIAYGHTSHGSQVTTGMTGLTTFANAPHGGSTYAWNDGGTGGALDLADAPFSGAWDLGNPDFTAWATATRSYIDDPANADVNVVMWSWCGEVSSASQADITTYLTLMSGLEQDYPDVSFVYMTGHTDGSGLTGNLHVRNQQIRDYCEANDKVLYDFEDIESYDPDGTYFGDRNVADSCDYNGGNWATEWQDSHTQGVDWYSCDSAHSQPLNANLKAYAAWWLWARLAGWNRLPTPTVSGFTPASGRTGRLVSVTGSGFTGATAVTFGGVAASSFNVASDTQLAATVPLRASSGRVRVTTATGIGASATRFTVKAHIERLTPISAQRGAIVVITDSGFGARRAVSSVRFGSVKCAKYFSWSRTRITCRVPARAFRVKR